MALQKAAMEEFALQRKGLVKDEVTIPEFTPSTADTSAGVPNGNNRMVATNHPLVFRGKENFSFLKQSTCDELLSHLSMCETLWKKHCCEEKGYASIRGCGNDGPIDPTLFANSGLTADDCGLKSWGKHFVKSTLEPLVKECFHSKVGVDDEDFFLFYLPVGGALTGASGGSAPPAATCTPSHIDDSVFTFTCTLKLPVSEKQRKKHHMVFPLTAGKQEISDLQRVNNLPTKENRCEEAIAEECESAAVVTLEEGTSVLFMGKTPHYTTVTAETTAECNEEPLTTGCDQVRHQLIFYLLPEKTKKTSGPKNNTATHDATPALAKLRSAHAMMKGINTAPSTSFYSHKYAFYLSQKHTKASLYASHKSHAFLVPSLDGYYERYCRNMVAKMMPASSSAKVDKGQTAKTAILGKKEAATRRDGAKEGVGGTEEKEILSAPQHFSGVEELVNLVGSFLPLRERGLVLPLVSTRWKEFTDGWIWGFKRSKMQQQWHSDLDSIRRESAENCGASADQSRSMFVVSLGGLGNSAAAHFWEQLAASNGLDTEGSCYPGKAGGALEDPFLVESAASTIGGSQLRFRPNAVFVDTDDAVSAYFDALDGEGVGAAGGMGPHHPLVPWRYFYHPSMRVAGKRGDSAHIAARALYNVGEEVVLEASEEIRRQLEQHSNPHGAIVFRGLAGGTGSALFHKIWDVSGLATQKGLHVADAPILPSFEKDLYPHCAAYNSALGVHWGSAEHMNLRGGTLHTHVFTSPALQAAYNSAVFSGGWKWQGGPKPTNHQLAVRKYTPAAYTSIAATAMLGTFASVRRGGALDSDMAEMHTSLVPYPAIHYLETSMAPMYAQRQQCCEQLSTAEITNAVFERTSNLSRYPHPSNDASAFYYSGKYMACSLHFHGDVVPKDVMAAVATIKTKRTIQFVDWCPTGFKCGINYQKLPQGPSSVLDFRKQLRQITLTSNNTRIAEPLCQIACEMDRYYSKRSFVHHYVAEGMEEGEFAEAREFLASLEKDYEEVGLENALEEEEDDEY